MTKIIIHDFPMYTSDELKELLKKMIEKYAKGEIKNLLLKNVDDGILIPIINTPSKIKQFLLKIQRKKPPRISGVTQNGKAYVIMEKQSPQGTIDTALHEMVHIGHVLQPKKFHMINMPLYVRFYSYYFKQLFKAKSYDKDGFTKFIKTISADSAGDYHYWSTYDTILYNTFKDYTTLSEEGYRERIELVKDAVHDHMQLSYYNIVIALLRKTYRILFKTMAADTGVGAETWSPGEIIAVLSTIDSTHPNVVKSLKLITPNKKPVINDRVKNMVR